MPPKRTGRTTSSAAGSKVTKRNKNQLRAMSHPVRAQTLRLLSDRGKMSPAEIGREIGESSDKVSYHLKQLVAYDCAELVEKRQVKGKGAVEHFYIATARHILDTEDWEALAPGLGQAVLKETMTAIIEDYEESRAAGVVGADAQLHVSRTPLVLDRQGIEEAMENSERWRLEQSEIELRSAARRAESGERGTHVSSSLAFFKMPRPN